METEKIFLAREIGKFIWDAFCDPDGLGVSLRDVLDGASIVGVHLTENQKKIFFAHMEDVDALTYPAEFEEVRDQIAAATDYEDYEKMYSWLAYVVGDIMAEVMVMEWKGEFTEE